MLEVLWNCLGATDAGEVLPDRRLENRSICNGWVFIHGFSMCTKPFSASIKNNRHAQGCFVLQEGTSEITNKQELLKKAMKHYRLAFLSEGSTYDQRFFDSITKCITEEQDSQLVQMPLKGELKDIALGISAGSASRSDGFSGVFFHKCCDIISEDLYSVVQEFYEGKDLPRCYTTTILSLIPKTIFPEIFQR